jgi:sulfoacetaldehyde dehydrogenase
MTDTVHDMVARARGAQAVIGAWTQAQVDEMVAAVGWAVYQRAHAEACARLACDETGMGIYEHKLLKHQKKTLGTLRDLHGVKSVGLIEEDRSRGLLKFAKPVGVVGALTPVTNASSTICCNGLSILKGRNAVIFAPHPSATRTAELTCSYMRAALRQVRAPEHLVQNIAEPSIPLTQELMKAADLIVATGGAAMVKSAYSSGTPAYGVGAGNSVCIVDETADLSDAARKIAQSKTFDNATSCSSENSLVIQAAVYDRMIRCLDAEGGYLCSAVERERLKCFLWPDGIHLNKRVPGQGARVIADAAGVVVPESTRFLMVLGETIGREDPFSGEKLSPVLTLWKFQDFPEAIEYVQRITGFIGRGHSCSLHTIREDRIRELGMQARVSRIMVRQSQCYGNSGDYINGMPFSLTLGCGTWGGNIASENITWKHFLNTTWVSLPIEPVVPSEDALFGEHWAKFGKGECADATRNSPPGRQER